jgi:kynureninase
MSDVAFSALRSHFPLLDERVYFASQCLGPTPAAMFDDLEAYRRSVLLRKRAIPEWIGRIEELTALLESLINAPPGSVALRDGATSAQAAIAAAIEPVEGRNRIVISSLDFHSTRYLWTAQRRRGFEVVELSPADELAVRAADYAAAADDRTAIVEAALVSPRTGALVDARALIRTAHEHGAIAVLDAYQAVGVVPIDVQELDADVIVGGTHKWLGGGGTGLAFLYVRPTLAEKLEPVYPGWVGHASIGSFSDEWLPAVGARRFQVGFPAMEPIYTARAGLRLALEIGVPRIRARSLELTARIIERADAHGLRVTTPRRPEARGGILCIDTPRAEPIAESLEERGIDVDYRPGAGIRLAPHFCHREDECDKVIDGIAELNHR